MFLILSTHVYMDLFPNQCLLSSSTVATIMASEQCDGAEDHVSLPASVASDAESLPSLPPSVGAEESDLRESHGAPAPAAAATCCKKGFCPQRFSPDEIANYKLQFQTCTPEEKRTKVFEEVKSLYKKASQAATKEESVCVAWQICDKPVCRRYWEQIHRVGHGALDKLLALAKQGNLTVPPRGPRLPRQAPAQDTADVWFLGLYKSLAEPLAIPGSQDQVVGPEIENEALLQPVVVNSTHPLHCLAVNTSGLRNGRGEPAVPKRYLNFSSEADLWNFYQQDESIDQQVSKTSFNKAWQSWRSYMPLKNAGQQSKCNVCASLSEARAQALDALARAEVDKEKKDHLNVVMADRKVNVRGNKLASKPEVWFKESNEESFMKIQIDGMDQSKFTLPRLKRLVGTSALSKAWRPMIHITGVIVWGMLEYYVLMPPDCPKDSNMNATVIARVLDILVSKLKAKGGGFGLPPHLIINCDNTPREGKNSHFASFLSSVIAAGCFRSIQVEFLQVDHTHNELDQRFSSMASAIKGADCIETPADLRQWLQDNMKATAGRDLMVEELPNTWDFRKWISESDAGLHVRGLASTHTEPFACHVWTLQPRLFVTETEDIDVHRADWKDLSQHPQDVIMSCKQYMSSADLAQKPFMFLGC